MKNFSLKETLIKYSDLFYYISLSIGLLSFTWIDFKDPSFIDKFDTYRMIISIFFLMLRGLSLFLIDKKYTYKSFLFSIPFLLSLYFCRTIYLIQSLAFILCAYKIDKNKVIKIFICSSILTILISTIGSLCGLVNLTLLTTEKYSRFRLYFGFKHPSYFSIHYLAILFGIWYLYLKDKCLKSTIIFILSSLFLYYVPNTRTSAIILFIFPIILSVTKYTINSNNKMFKYLIILLPSIFTLLSLLLMFAVKSAPSSSFLETFTIRFTQANAYYQACGIHLFKSSGLWLDNLYLFLLEHFGIICTIVYIGLLTLLNVNLIKENNYHVLSIAIFFLIYSLMDNYGINIRFNHSLLFIPDILLVINTKKLS